MNHQSLGFILSQPQLGQAMVTVVREPTRPCMPSQGAVPHSLEPSRLHPPGTEAQASGGPARAAFHGQNLTVSRGIYSLSLHTGPLEVDWVSPELTPGSPLEGAVGSP